MQRKSFLFMVSIVAFVLVAGLSGYKYWQYTIVTDEISLLKNQFEASKVQYNDLTKDNLGNIFIAKKALNKIEEEGMKWSKVIKDIIRTVPENVSGDPVVEILSYSGAGGRDINLNITTSPDSGSPYFDVADFIAAFDVSKLFMNGFVPSIASGVNAEGKEVLSFTFSTQYLGENALIER